jgi:3',5'-cyclic AMP phosphodiesterase CpdA
MRLATFVHISDLHFKNQAQDAAVSRLYALMPGLDGLLGHSYKSLTLLDPFFVDLQTSENAQLLITGDLTRVGNALEFQIADQYLGSELTPPLGNLIGLWVSNWLQLSIPGNHDRFPGIPFLWGGPTREYHTTFPSMPRIVDFQLQSSRKHLLRLILIDTDADVSGWSLNRGAARGSFFSQIRALRGLLSPPREFEIRVLCLHHSRAKGGYFLRIASDSRRALDAFIVDHEISVLLSGHIHDPALVKVSTATSSTGSRKYLEARCGTTTQTNLYHIPYYWRKLPGFLTGKGHWSNTIFVHRLSEQDGEIIWETELFLEGPDEFEPPVSVPKRIMVDPSIRVWPRS